MWLSRVLTWLGDIHSMWTCGTPITALGGHQVFAFTLPGPLPRCCPVIWRLDPFGQRDKELESCRGSRAGDWWARAPAEVRAMDWLLRVEGGHCVGQDSRLEAQERAATPA